MQTQLALQTGDRQLALDVFCVAQTMPSVTTEASISADGFRVNGSLFPESSLFVCYKQLTPFVVKPLCVFEAKRLKALLAAVGSSGSRDDDYDLHRNIVPFSLKWEDAAKAKCFMVMPKLHVSLDVVPPLCEQHAARLLADVRAALEYLHDHGFAHADVKPANICLRDSGEFVLIDLGSVVPFGGVPKTTPAYVPHDVAYQRCTPELDLWMLGMTLGETCCAAAPLDIANALQSVTRAKLLAHLWCRLPSDVWQAYQAVMEPHLPEHVRAQLRSGATCVTGEEQERPREVIWNHPAYLGDAAGVVAPVAADALLSPPPTAAPTSAPTDPP